LRVAVSCQMTVYTILITPAGKTVDITANA
jgi:hypothetical protein